MIVVRAKGFTAVYAGRSRWSVKGRGQNRTMDHGEFYALLNPQRKRKEGDERKHAG